MDHRRFEVSVETDHGGETTERELLRLRLQFQGGPREFAEWLDSHSRSDLAPEEIDIAYRYPRQTEESDLGVLGFGDRVTGNLIAECPLGVDRLERFVTAASTQAEQTEDNFQYRLTIESGEKTVTEALKQLLLVYDRTGTLSRERSLIPAGIEL